MTKATETQFESVVALYLTSEAVAVSGTDEEFTLATEAYHSARVASGLMDSEIYDYCLEQGLL